MAFKVSDYGSGALGDVSSVTETVNSYARVAAISGKNITINADTKIEGTAKFEIGAKVLLHVSAAASTSKTYLGKYLLANITAVNSNVFTLDQDADTNLIPSGNLAQFYVQIIAVAQYKNLTLDTGTTITPPVYSASSYHGGIVAIMCSERLTFGGGHISLTDRGIPTGSTALRPLFAQETSGTDDIHQYSGWENDCSRHFPLNCGDGAAFIVAKEMVCNANSRIGNINAYGVQFYRGATNSVTYNETAPSNVTNVGGSSIFIAAETISGFNPKMIAKYRAKSSAAGQGICRCYIASETKLRNDEGLYAYDCISTPVRLMRDMNIKDFGNGSFGDMSNVTSQVNNYATVTAISGNKVTYKNQTTAGLAQISAGALVMIHWNHKDSANVVESGRFILAKVLSDNGSVLTLDTTPPNISVTDYACQIVAIPQCNNFTLSGTNSATVKFNGAQGGIFAVAVKNNCDLSNGKINVQQKGGGAAYGRDGLAVIGNAQDSNKLPIGQGHGSVFILAKNLTVNTATRLGYTASGAGVFPYRGQLESNKAELNTVTTSAGSGANGGITGTVRGAKLTLAGGYGGNSSAPKFEPSSTWMYRGHIYQGAHVMIIADTINTFNLALVSTGGGLIGSAGRGDFGNGNDIKDGTSYYTAYPRGGYNGGGAGQADWYGGGSSGWAFIYCNEAVEQNTDGIVLAD